MVRNNKSKEDLGFVFNSDILVYCPYSKGICIKRNISPEKVKDTADRRSGAERRVNETISTERRWLKTNICQLYKTDQCPASKYPSLQNKEGILASLCNSKAILDLV